MGAKVSFTVGEDNGHDYPDATAPTSIAEWCYGQLDADITVNAHTYVESGTDWTSASKGSWRRFDQREFLADNVTGNTTKLLQYGFYYVPTACENTQSSCQLQLVMHGGGMNAESFGPIFGPYAAANNVILIVPQAEGGWEELETIGSTPEDDDQYTNEGVVMKFIKALTTRATTAKEDSFVADLATGEHTYGSGHPEGVFDLKDKTEGESSKDEWVHADGVWTNQVTGEVWGDDASGEKNPGAKGDDFKDEWKVGDKKDWSEWGSKDDTKDKDDKKEGEKDDDKAMTLVASAIASLAVTFNMF